MKKCVVSFSDTPFYQNKMKRLEQSLKGNFDGDFLGFTSVSEIGCESHSVIPYKFKPYAIKKAADMGYELILWCDSPVYAQQDIQPVFNHIEKHGYVFFDNIGFSLGDYTNDKTLDFFRITRSESWKIKMIMACCMGFDRRNPKAWEFLSQYISTANDLYPGEWENDEFTESGDMRCRGHRHDQSVASCIIERLGLKILKGQDTFFAYYEHKNRMPISDSVCLYSG